MTAVGIDLGTTNSCVAVWRGGRVDVLPEVGGDLILPSVVAHSANGEWTVGMLAKRFAETNPLHTYRAVKRLIGRRFADAQVEATQAVSSFKIAAAENGEAWIEGRDGLVAPAHIQAHVLRRLKSSAELAMGRAVTAAVVTVPAYFNDAQRKATLEAGEIAGLKVLRIINEPTAAAMALELDRSDEPLTVAIYDLGGGTFDLSILTIDQAGEIEVICSNGDTFLGGEDWDRRIVDHVAEAFLAEHGVDLRADPLTLQRLKLEAEQAKRTLSEVTEATLGLQRIKLLGQERIPVDYFPTITREQLEAMTGDLVARTIDRCRLAMEDAELTVADIDRVVLVGGQTRAPAVQEAVRSFFPGVRVLSPDPDQIVARGAAVMAAALTGALARELEDVTPFAVGVEDANGQMVVVVNANEKIPARRTLPFSTLGPDQEAVRVRLRQGNSENAADNLPLGMFDLSGVRAKDGRRVIDVTVDIDADGTMTAGARDRGSGRTQQLSVDTMGLSPRAIDKLRKMTASAGKQQDATDAAAAAQT